MMSVCSSAGSGRILQQLSTSTHGRFSTPVIQLGRHHGSWRDNGLHQGQACCIGYNEGFPVMSALGTY